MRPFIVLFLSPVLWGAVSLAVFRSVRRASFAATLGAPLLIFAVVKVVAPDEPWGVLATCLMSPLVIALAVVTVFVCAGHAAGRGRRRAWADHD